MLQLMITEAATKSPEFDFPVTISQVASLHPEDNLI
jgi:hypothetical protein